ncbi:MAG: acyltransferase [Desulfobacteraceae bacterium]|nr:acyltransferase [Desulfobacteraceae bacterium]
MENVKIYDSAKIAGIENIQFGHHIIVDDFVFIYAKKKIKIGNYVHIAAFSSITGGEEVVLEDFSCISWGARIFTATDDFTGSGFGNSTVPEEYRRIKRAPVHIGRFVIVGANSVVLPGVVIGEGTTVGANSVVTRDLEPWGVHIGDKKIADRDKTGVMANFKSFLDSQKLA